MNKHAHLLLHEEDDNIARLMKRISVSFFYYFNKKYKILLIKNCDIRNKIIIYLKEGA